MTSRDNVVSSKQRMLGIASVAAAAVVSLVLSHGMARAEQELSYPPELDAFDPANFAHPTQIDNEWMPMTPGTQLIFKGSTIDKNETVGHRVVFTVTGLEKEIAGIRTRVCWDRDYSGGVLQETELIFLAQDNEGNLWRIGEYPEEYYGDKLVGAPAWIHGYEGARAGIMMEANPRLGTPSYAQGWGPAVDWTDRGQTYKMGEKISVPQADYDDVLVIDETAASEPGAHQLKYYARGVGNIKVGYMGDDPTKEVLELVELVHLTPEQLEEVHAACLEQERRAYDVSLDVYAHTTPIIGHDFEPPARVAAKPTAEPVRKISDEQARAIALAAAPGEVMDVVTETKLGAKRLVVEVIRASDQSEVDVIIDLETGEVLAIMD